MMDAITSFFKNRNKKQKYLAFFAAMITLICMYLFYGLEFSISTKDDEILSVAIDEYFFTETVEANILARENIGRELFVFFQRDGYVGHYGIAVLERGIFGKYRFLNAGLNDFSLYWCNYADGQRLGKEYLVICGLYDLPNVTSYAVFSYDNTEQEPLFQNSAEKAPFLRIVKTNGENIYSPFTAVHYYDDLGAELDKGELLDSVPVAVEGKTPSVGSAELGLVYFILGVIFLLGLCFVRYFLLWGEEKEPSSVEVEKGKKQD
ncbi:hypothetical protein CLNEO_24680 [Anaerotignum neopropionicum]|uniref:Uncharacterized protein n=1 Tax=Anaerotignum neopropionicum TaxID=36847 RepID=A0A136WCS6_9FIRM|nr:hypothetical protein [Anaerotignum neopropionicum]KXL52119.1 hypothetical protein CLNEO_24680 [Anaerotignum neopropionicum]